MSSELILALDLGTSSTRTSLFDLDGRRLAGTTAQQSYPLITSADGAAELDPGVLLLAVMHCLEQTMHALRTDPTLHGRPVAGIGVSCFWHSLVGCDAKGVSLTNIVTWADSRCREEAAKLRERFEERKMHARTGCMLRASFWPAKLRWLERTHHRKFTAVKQWMSPAEWLQLTLAGEANCAIGMATGTGLFNPAKLAWEPELLKFCEVQEEQFRPVSDEPTPVRGRLSAQFPELQDVPWFPGIGDGAASNLGSGATRPGLAAINVGTSAALRVMRDSGPVQAPFGLFCYRVDAERFLVGGAVSNAGNLRAWCLRELKLAPEVELETELARRPGPDHGLVVLPFWTAERAPTWNEEATGAIQGLTQHTTSLDLLQAITEATYHRLARIAELVLTTEKTPPKFIVSGGIQRSPSSLQRLSDVLGQTVYPNDEMEASIRGAAIFAMEKLGFEAPEAQVGRAVRPRAKFVKLYAAEREKQRALEEM
ncbi:MAG: gluconokinase [Chthoniobacter sp.]|jgi:gluconokinase|nr:gluconokinase [Chthoniobacter sp.]